MRRRVLLGLSLCVAFVTAAPNDCRVSSWTLWTGCSKTCGTGYQSRTRSVIASPSQNGVLCGALFEEKPCMDFLCPSAIHCKVAGWGPWSRCSKTCGGGSRSRKQRYVIEKAKHGGDKCPPLVDTKLCDVEDCPVEEGEMSTKSGCRLSAWGAWSKCSKSCTKGVHTRVRIVLNQVKGCTEMVSTETCDNGPCPIDCKVSPFTPWTPCTKLCGGGITKRSRAVIRKSNQAGIFIRDIYFGICSCLM